MTSWSRYGQSSSEKDRNARDIRAADHRFTDTHGLGIQTAARLDPSLTCVKTPVKPPESSIDSPAALWEQIEDEMTEPLNVKRSLSSTWNDLSASRAANRGEIAKNMSRSQLDQQIEVLGEIGGRTSSIRQQYRFSQGYDPSEVDYSRRPHATQSFSSSTSDAPAEDDGSGSFGNYGEFDTSEQDITRSLKMAGSRPPSRTSKARSRAASTASSFAAGLEDDKHQGYLFLEAIPPLPPRWAISDEDSPFGLKFTPQPNTSGDYAPLHTSAEKGKGRVAVDFLDRVESTPYTMTSTSKRPASPARATSSLSLDGNSFEKIIKSPQHAWYLLRRLVGLELRWEATRVWRMGDLNSSERRGKSPGLHAHRTYLPSMELQNGSFASGASLASTSVPSENLPIFRYMIQNFLLTFPIIRDTISMVPNTPGTSHFDPSNSDPFVPLPVYWNAGLLPVLKRVHQANLSASVDMGAPGFIGILFGSYAFNCLERFVATGIKISHRNSPHSRKEQPDSHTIDVPAIEGHPKNFSELSPLSSELEKLRGYHLDMQTSQQARTGYNHEPPAVQSRDNTQGLKEDLTEHTRALRDTSTRILDPQENLNSLPEEPSARRDSGGRRRLMEGLGKESHRHSGVSLQASQRASIGVVTPSNSNFLYSPKSHLNFKQEPQPSQPQNSEAINHLSPKPEASPKLHFVRSHNHSIENTPGTPEAISNFYDAINIPTINLSQASGFNGRWDSTHSNPTTFGVPSEKQNLEASSQESSVSSVRETIKRLRQGGDNTRSGSTSKMAIPDKENLSIASMSWTKIPESKIMSLPDDQKSYGAEGFQRKSSRSDLSRAYYHEKEEPLLENQYKESLPSQFNQEEVRGYDVDEKDLVFNHSQASGRPLTPAIDSTATDIYALQVAHAQSYTLATSTESLGHYQKRVNPYKIDRSRLISAVGEHKNSSSESQLLSEISDHTSDKTALAKLKRRFTLRSLRQPKSGEKSGYIHNTQDVSGHSRTAEHVNSDDIGELPLHSITIASSHNHLPLTPETGGFEFYAPMALPESIMPGFSGARERLMGLTNPPQELDLLFIRKSSSTWPWGEPVPFWKGTPVHKVRWGGFEVDLVAIKQNARGQRFIIRVRRPSRLDEYVVRKASDFRRYCDVLTKEFPHSHTRNIPDREFKYEKEKDNMTEIFYDTSETIDFSTGSSTGEFSENPRRISSENLGQRIRQTAESCAGADETSHGHHTDPFVSNFDKKNTNRKSMTIAFKPKRRNTLASLFNGGAHKSRFSLDTTDEGYHGNTREGGYHPPHDREIVGNGINTKISIVRRPSLHSIKLSPDAHRRVLREWLRDALSIRNVGHHHETAAFLLLGSIIPDDRDLLDMRERETIDQQRRNKRVQIAQGAAERAKSAYGWWQELKKELVYGDGISEFETLLRKHDQIEKLPIKYQKSIEWFRMNIAEVLHELLVIGDQSELLFRKLVNLYETFPWFLIRSVLKIRKTKLMYKALIELFFKRKTRFGKTDRNLFQRLTDLACYENEGGDDDMENRIQACRSRIQSLTMCEKLIKFSYAPRETKELFRNYAESEDMELVVTIVRSAEEPRLDKYDLQRILRASRIYRSLLKKNRDRITTAMTENINVRLILDLKLYLRLINQERDSKKIREIFEEDNMKEPLKILASPIIEFLKRTYKASNAAFAVEDAQKFFEQLIIIIKALRCRIQDPQKSIRALSRLLRRHQTRLYAWLHSLHIHDSIVGELLQWLKTVMMFLERGFMKPISITPILASDNQDPESLSKELDDLVEWERKKRRRQYEQVCRHYSADVDGDDPVTVEGDGLGKSKMDPLVETKPKPPRLDQIVLCLHTFRVEFQKISI